MGEYYVYIISSKSRAIYTGVTSNLIERVSQHKEGTPESFTRRYNIKRLVYYETYGEVTDAIAREKQIKGWKRFKKVELIESVNPNWVDLGRSLVG